MDIENLNMALIDTKLKPLPWNTLAYGPELFTSILSNQLLTGYDFEKKIKQKIEILIEIVSKIQQIPINERRR